MDSGAPFNLLEPLGWRGMLKLSALRHDVRVSDILGPSRVRDVVEARHEAIHLIWVHCDRGSEWIGQRLALESSTVRHALRKLEGMPRRGGPTLFTRRRSEKWRRALAAAGEVLAGGQP